MPADLWDWAAVVAGLRPAGDVFIPSYWCAPALLTVPEGWAFSTATVLAALTVLSVLGIALFVWRRHPGFLCASCAIWGALTADSPFAVLLPIVFVLTRDLTLRVAKWVKCDVSPSLRLLPWRRLGGVFAVSFVAAAVCNFARTGVPYVAGYVRNALAAVRWDGGWHPLDVAAMDGLLDGYVAELAREAADAKWIFTDGICDAGIELKGTARTVSLAEGARDEAHWRGLGFVRREDLSALENGASALMRTWAVDHPGELSNAVFQCGFAFLDREAAGKVEPCGLTVRRTMPPGAGPDVERRRAAESTRALAEGIVKFYREGGKPGHGGRARRVRFCVMQWRVARAVRRLATEFDRKTRVKEALAATALAEELDRLNPFAHRRDGMAEAADLRAFGSLTPREGLAFALKRANFALARRFALPIVADKPDDPEANFALAMDHLALREHAQARHYFQIALKARPGDATLLNNLAVASLMLGDFADAEEKAQAALAAKPDSEAIKDTLRQVQNAKRGK